MKKLFKQLTSILLAVLLLLPVLPGCLLPVSAETYSGTCGNALTWSLDTATGVLTITGTGEMEDDSSSWDSYRSNIKTVTIGDSVTSIGDDAFSDCTSLVSITIPDSVTSIGWDAFSGCTSLTSITIPDSVTSIGWGAFYGCTSLASITIPDSVTSIDDFAFSDCTSLTSIMIPDSVTFIGDNAFFNTGYYNNSANWTGNVLYIDNCLIEANTSITGEYAIRPGTKVIGYGAFEDCEDLTSITIPGSVTYIDYEAFSGCTSLTSIMIPDSVTYIGYEAFAWCEGLTSITIPGSVTYIDDGAFYECTKLTDIYYTGDETDWENINMGIGAIPEGVTVHYNYCSAVPGDVDGDGEITSTDARLVLQYYAKKIGEDAILAAMADVDGDGEITSTDARLILQYYAKKITAFPAK